MDPFKWLRRTPEPAVIPAWTPPPPNLRQKPLDVTGQPDAADELRGRELDDLTARNLDWVELPEGLKVRRRLDLAGCRSLERLPERLNLVSLSVRDCVSLPSLPEGVRLNFLDASGSGLAEWPSDGELRIGHVNLNGCEALTELPEWIADVGRLDVGGCVALAELPAGLRVSSFVEVAGSGLGGLPPGLAGVEVRWRDVPVPHDVAFRPDTISADQVLDAGANLEYRRVLLEIMGFARFLDEVQAVELDRDTDPGGERRLLKAAVEGDEDLVCVVVKCPSSARRYVIRVPPDTKTCREAVAWIAGFDDADDYAPVLET